MVECRKNRVRPRNSESIGESMERAYEEQGRIILFNMLGKEGVFSKCDNFFLLNCIVF